MSFEKFIINEYEHGHEKDQFNTIFNLLKDYYKDSAVPVFYFGNINVGGCELDSLLLTPNCAIIIEFKNYGGIINITDNSWTNITPEKTIIVKGGGNDKTPADQANINRCHLLDSIVDFKGIDKDSKKEKESIRKALPVMIVFNKSIMQSGKLPFIWLKVTDNGNFKDTLGSIESSLKGYSLFKDGDEIVSYGVSLGVFDKSGKLLNRSQNTDRIKNKPLGARIEGEREREKEIEKYAIEFNYIIDYIFWFAVILLVYNLSDLFGWSSIHDLTKAVFILVAGLFVAGVFKLSNKYKKIYHCDEFYKELQEVETEEKYESSEWISDSLILAAIVVLGILAFAFGAPFLFKYVYNLANNNTFDMLYNSHLAFFSWLNDIRKYFLFGAGLFVVRWASWLVSRGHICNKKVFLTGSSFFKVIARRLNSVLIYAVVVGVITSVFAGGVSFVRSCSNNEKTEVVDDKTHENDSDKNERQSKASTKVTNKQKISNRSKSKRKSGKVVKSKQKTVANDNKITARSQNKQQSSTTVTTKNKLTWVHVRFDNPIQFESGSYRLSEINKAGLRAISQTFKENPNFILYISGSEINQYERRNGLTDLPIVRNEVVHKYFRELGVTNKVSKRIDKGQKAGSVEIYMGVYE